MDETLTRIAAAVERGRSGEPGPARAELIALWAEIGPTGDPFHRCTLAHYLADLEESAEAELGWDNRALAAATELTDERVQRHDATFRVQAFLPSLHLNLADVHRRLADQELARQHLTAARDLLHLLPEDAYGAMVRAGVDHVASALDAGSTARLDSHP
jgi:hypothetical protein